MAFSDLGPPLRLKRQLRTTQWEHIADDFKEHGLGSAFQVYLNYMAGYQGAAPVDHITLADFVQDFANNVPDIAPITPPAEEPEPEPDLLIQERKFEFKEGPWAPSALINPKTHDFITDPVTTRAGSTYERKDIEDHLKENKRDPATNSELKSTEVIPNFALKHIIAEVKNYNQAHDAKEKDAILQKIEALFNDPIIFEPLDKPVLTVSGHTYSRDAIKTWLSKKLTNPLTGAALSSTLLIPNRAIADIHQEFLAYQKYFKDHLATVSAESSKLKEDKTEKDKKTSDQASASPSVGLFSETEAKVISPQELMNRVDQLISKVETIQEPNHHLASLNRILILRLREFKEKKAASPECLKALQDANTHSLKGEAHGMLDTIIKNIDKLDLKIKPTLDSGLEGPRKT